MPYKHLILFVVAILIFGLSFVIIKWPQNKHMSFSQHVAVRKIAIFYYIGLFSVVLPLLVIFFIGWFVPHLKLSGWFSVCIVASAICQYSVTFIPEVGGWMTRYHRIVTGLSGILLIPPLMILLGVDSVGLLAKIVTAVALLAMVAVISVSLFYGNRKYMLILQSCYYGAFFMAIITITYFA